MSKKISDSVGCIDWLSSVLSRVFKSRFRLRHNMRFVLRDSKGNLKKEFEFSNLITNAGVAGVASRINGAGGEAAFDYIALGTGTTTENATDTALEAEITSGGGERASATVSRTTTDVTNDTATNVNTFTFTSSFAITESGVFNASSGGTMLSRKVFSAMNVVSGDALEITWSFDVD